VTNRKRFVVSQQVFSQDLKYMNRTVVLRPFIALALPLLLVIAACASQDTIQTPTSIPEIPEPTLDVITTSYAVTYFSERVAGDRARIEPLITAGVDAHAFEPVPSDVIAIGEADVLVYNHPAFETWVADAVTASNNQLLIIAKTADLPDDVELALDHGDDDDGHDEEEHDSHVDEHDSIETELVEALAHVVEEVEHGDITAAQGFIEIEEVLHEAEGEHEVEDHADSNGEEKEGAHFDELVHELEEIVAEVESGVLSHDAGVEQVESVLGAHDHEGEEHEEHADHDEDEHGDHDEDESDDEHSHQEGLDPHVWLSPLEAIKQVRAIQSAFSTADPAGADQYAQNADTLVDELESLNDEFSTGLSSCGLDHMVVSHKAYGHLAELYGVEQIGLQGLSTEGDANPQQVAQIVDEMVQLGVKHVLQEPIAGSALADTVANETGSKVLSLHPMESLTSAELAGGATYFTIMRENLNSLRVALECS